MQCQLLRDLPVLLLLLSNEEAKEVPQDSEESQQQAQALLASAAASAGFSAVSRTLARYVVLSVDEICNGAKRFLPVHACLAENLHIQV